MGVFHEMVEIINRTATPKNVRYDGQDKELEPNYTPDGQRIEGVHNLVPKQVVPYALNQNVIMGSEEAHSPSEFQSSIGVIKTRADKKTHSWHNIEFYDETQNKETTRVSREAIEEDLIADPRFKTEQGGRKRRTTADLNAGGPAHSTTPFDFKETPRE